METEEGTKQEGDSNILQENVVSFSKVRKVNVKKNGLWTYY